MFLLDDDLVYSASDLAWAATCEFSLLRAVDAELGLVFASSAAPDPMWDRTARLGNQHERRQLDSFRSQYDRVVEIGRPAYTSAALTAATESTRDALSSQADVVYQGAFFTGSFLGFCDFLVREGDRYSVHDTKLSRHARVPVLLQLAAYADALRGYGIEPAADVHLLLGDGSVSSHRLRELEPIFRERRERLEQIIELKRAELVPVQWADPRFTACGRCDSCLPEIESSRDLLLVAGMSIPARSRLIDEGITTIDNLAEAAEKPDAITSRTFTAIRRQASLQVRQERCGEDLYEIVDSDSLAAIPPPDAGDIFFDFEGDPLWAESGSPEWGLEYLFGVREADTGRFKAFWAHDRREERGALLAFLTYLGERRVRYPDMHVYHYAAYEKSALLRLAGRHGAGEAVVDDLLRDRVLVDLYPIVRSALRVGARSCSLKKLEPLYMGDELRAGDVTNAADSITAYATFCDLRDDGHNEDAERILAEIADYNAYDCLSTQRLRDWLLDRAHAEGVVPHPVSTAESESELPNPTEVELRDYVGDQFPDARTDDQQAAALMAAALGYHRRERKPFWWAHFDRLTHPVDEWADSRDVLLVEDGAVELKWHKQGRQRNYRRHLELTGRFGTGSTIAAGNTVYTLYDPPTPLAITDDEFRRAYGKATVREVGLDEEFRDVVLVEETLPRDADEYDAVPLAVTPGPPIATKSIESAIESAAEQMRATLPALPANPAVDILRRIPPRLRAGAMLPEPAPDGCASAIAESLAQLDNSYIAVQGPPGTGKTFTGARVVAQLVEQRGWKIGVVAQSHAAVENMLDAVVEAGIPGEQVAKKQARALVHEWTELADDQHAEFLASSGSGCVIGGTTWDFTNRKRIAEAGLDLLVIDEAGQFCLANTIAVATSARNLLLLGDPQQLPQVSQGTHPEPVHQSALGWLTQDRGTLPREFGYFLERTWRMHPALCGPVSELAYDGKLHAEESVTGSRHLAGLAAGVHTVVVEHTGNATESAEEATEIVRRVRALLGSSWLDSAPGSSRRPLRQSDFLVVAPYNAQVALIRGRLARAGFGDVPVGTVDRFQGREAAIVIVSMTASAIEDVPRGVSFLLSRNRLNVAVSRAKWAAIVVRSRLLTDYLPSTPAGLSELGAFMQVCADGSPEAHALAAVGGHRRS